MPLYFAPLNLIPSLAMQAVKVAVLFIQKLDALALKNDPVSGTDPKLAGTKGQRRA